MDRIFSFICKLYCNKVIFVENLQIYGSTDRKIKIFDKKITVHECMFFENFEKFEAP